MNSRRSTHNPIVAACAGVLLSLSISGATLNYSVQTGFFDDRMVDGTGIGPCHGGAAISKTGEIYVSTDGVRGIAVFGPDGKYRRSMGPMRIHGMEIREEKGVEYIYGARPADSQIVKVNLKGELEWSLGVPREANLYKEPSAYRPCAVTVGPDGSLFAADGYGSNFVLKFDKDRKFVKAFGGPGEEDGKFKTCHGITLDTRYPKPLLLVCNRNNNRVEHWDLEGNFVKVIQRNLRMPAAAQVQGDYAILPELQGRVTILDKAGNIAAQVGDNPNESQRANFGLSPENWKDGICNSPHGAAMDPRGNLVVSEWSKFGHLHRFVLAK